jgi:pullulanase
LMIYSLSILPLFSAAQKQTSSFDNYPVYHGNDLGVNYSPTRTLFKVWAPTATEVILRLYEEGDGGNALRTMNLRKEKNGTWLATIQGDLKNQYYTFQVKHEGKWLDETADMYAKAVGVNGKRGMIIDLDDTNPENWRKDKRPRVKSYTDIIIYESHIRDISIDNGSGIKNRGKYLGLTEAGTKSHEGLSTGLDHLKELGITHIHLLPAFDFNSIDESKLELNKYNWGYDPLHYNVPEGSFSSDPYDGKVRIREFKQMVQALHAKQIGVVMDVVYNHTSNLKTPFNQFAPGYFYRHNKDGSYSNASACGNETASERAMMRKFMIESMSYWAKEYHIDGFRVDLMGIHDIETMNLIRDALNKIDRSIFVYGEGWTAGPSPMPEELRAVKKNTLKLKDIAAFSDDIRDGLRGPYSNSKEKGFVSGKPGNAESVKFGIVASTQHPDIDYKKVSYSKAPWAVHPHQAINYVSCHDDPTLFDRLIEANPNASEADIIKMDKLAQTAVLTSQGVAFIHSGAEMLRTKMGVHNSYNLPDSINLIEWSRKTKYKNVFDYYKGLIALRKNHVSFRMPTTAMIQKHLKFIDSKDPLFISYQIQDVPGDKWKQIIVLLNGDKEPKNFELAPGKWNLAVDGELVSEKGNRELQGNIIVPATTAYILFK